MNEKKGTIGITVAVIVLIIAGVIFYFNQSTITSINDSGTLSGNFVVMLLDPNNKPTKYWVLQDDSIDVNQGIISFDEKDGQTIHLHANVIIKEFNDDGQLNLIKKDYQLK